MANPTQTAVVPVTVGFGLTVNYCVIGQPKLLVYVIFVDPGETLVTKPVLDTVATDVLLDNQGLVLLGVPVAVN